MNDHADSKLRELTYRLVDMAPEAPPFPEESMVQLEPSPATRLRQPALWFAAAATAVLLMIGVPLLIGSVGDSDSTVPPAAPSTVADVAPTTVSDHLTSSAEVPAESTAEGSIAASLPDLTVGTVVVGVPGAATALRDGVVVFDAETVIGDGVGGLVALREDTVVRVAPDGSEAVVLTAADLTAEFGPVALRLEDVVRIDESTKAVVVAAYGQRYPELFEEIWFLDLDSGVAESVYRTEAVESTITRVSAANGIMVLSWSFEGGAYFEYLDTSGQPIDVPAPFEGGLPGGVPDAGTGIDQAVISPDGSTFAYLEIDTTQAPDEDWSVDLVIWDLVRGAEQARLGIGLLAGTWYGRMDYDGVGAVLGRYQPLDGAPASTRQHLSPLRITSLGARVVTDVDAAGSPSLIKR